jgi:hypothetical protein
MDNPEMQRFLQVTTSYSCLGSLIVMLCLGTLLLALCVGLQDLLIEALSPR